MTVRIEKPVLNGRTPEENIAKLETWAANLTNDLNYYLNHIDSENMVKENNDAGK